MNEQKITKFGIAKITFSQKWLTWGPYLATE